MGNLSGDSIISTSTMQASNSQCLDEALVSEDLIVDQEREIERGILQDYLYMYGELNEK